VGIHEFSHLIDRFDGEVDGIPERLIKREELKKWLKIIEKEKTKIINNRSDINTYALTNNAEFFAVVCEYFFMFPKRFKKEHNELFLFMKKIFNH
jgi:MtfA peptidase